MLKKIEISIPTWESLQKKLDEADGLGADFEMTPLEKFIYENEPADEVYGTSTALVFRNGLAEALKSIVADVLRADGQAPEIIIHMEQK